MRVTVVEFSPAGGLYHFAVQLADALADLGHQVEIVTGPDPELSPQSAGVTVHPILATWHPATASEPWLLRKARRIARAARYAESWRRLARHLAADPPDVVQWAEWRFALDGWMVARLAGGRKRPIQADIAHTPRPFAEQQTSGSLYKAGRLMMASLRRGYAAMDVVFVLGATARRDLEECWPQVARVEVIPHGDEAALVGGGRDLGPASDGGAVLFFGTLARYKGLELLLAAWSHVRQTHPTARLVIAGAPADVDLGDLQRSADLVGGVDVRIGYVPLSDLPDLFASARLVVAPYILAYGSGVVALAHTCRRPVVVTDVGDLAAAVDHERTGLLVPPEAPQALAAAIVRLLDDPAEAAQLGDAGAARLKARAGWPTIAAQIAAVYADLLTDQARGGKQGHVGTKVVE